ncbi:MAG TPA: hypothetical protein PKL77_06160 [Candidatus Omnitrophota bacterium]|nr:hypothetical protein [Candidatus Omnitrophota bacterium]
MTIKISVSGECAPRRINPASAEYMPEGAFVEASPSEKALIKSYRELDPAEQMWLLKTVNITATLARRARERAKQNDRERGIK